MEGLAGLWPILLMFVLLYFLLIRPQQKRNKELLNMQSNLKKGDKIITFGGLHGTIDAVDEGTVIIKCEDGTKLTHDKGAVREVVQSPTE